MIAAVPRLDCAKHMTYGPCGGVALDGSCEVGGARCVFVDGPVVSWAGAAPQSSPADTDPIIALARRRPIVVIDLPDRPLDPRSTRAAAAALAGLADAVLLGDIGWSRVQLPPSYRASIVAKEGVRPWAGVNCRDRNRVAIEAELCALADIGAAAHCISGDHGALGHRADAAGVFDLDSTQVAALARRAGLLVSVAENPVAPPVALRAARLAEKAKAGAHVCFVNHAGSAAKVALFINSARALGLTDLIFIVCVPLLYSTESVAGIRTFTGLVLPSGLAETITVARDPFVAGVDGCAEYARSVLGLPGVHGINISGTHPPGDEARAIAAATALVGALS